MDDQLEPPPRGINLFSVQWRDWLFRLYDYVKGMGSRTNDPFITHAINVVAEQYGDKVSVDAKNKDLLKYGRTEQADNTTGGWTIMTLPTGVQEERDLYSNDIDKVTSSSTSDANKILVVEGHTYSAGNLTFVTQEVTLAANPTTTAATLTTPLRSATRAYLKASGTAGSPQSDLVGNVYFWDDNGGTLTISGGVPSDTSYVHLMIRALLNQSEKASTSISSTDYFFITGAYCNMLDKNTGAAAEVDVFARDVGNGGSWRKLFDMKCSTPGGDDYRIGTPYQIIPKNHDIKMVAYGDSASARTVAGGIFGVLAKIV